jgi:hypothetical protein
MSGLDIFAWIVLIVLAASAIGVFCIAGWLPGHIANGSDLYGSREGRTRHPQGVVAPDRDRQLCQPVLRAT